MVPGYVSLRKLKHHASSLKSSTLIVVLVVVICVLQIYLLAYTDEFVCTECTPERPAMLPNAFLDSNISKITVQDVRIEKLSTGIAKSVGTPETDKDIIFRNNSASLFFKKQDHKVNTHNYPYLLNELSLCGYDLYLLIYVFSLPKSFERRKVIRETYGSIAHSDSSRLRLVFILGNTGDSSLNSVVKNESFIYRDIIQEDFVESYGNLTIKSIAGLRWAAEYCPKAKFVLKTDDDVFINTIRLLKELQSMQKSNGVLLGAYNGGVSTVRHGRWRLTEEQYPFDTLPPYVSGAGYVMSMDVVRKLFFTSEYVMPLPLEDVYTTGVVARIAEVTPRSHPGFGFWTDIINQPCTFLQTGLMTSHAMAPDKMRNTWRVLTNGSECKV